MASRLVILLGVFLVSYALAITATVLPTWLTMKVDYGGEYTFHEGLFQDCWKYPGIKSNYCTTGVGSCQGTDWEKKFCHRRNASAAMMIFSLIAGLVALVTLGLTAFTSNASKRTLGVVSVFVASLMQFIAWVLFADKKSMLKEVQYSYVFDNNVNVSISSSSLGAAFALCVVSWIIQSAVGAGLLWWDKERTPLPGSSAPVETAAVRKENTAL
ncbi:hypothetical protein BC832DRAFT_566089 [Gaertneriomyces semiglobifer]|nr:hypothetical protein BC832DRAFT_566089 [Gaertneriomyces semiglobifer]